jgi:hypothetical protein
VTFPSIALIAYNTTSLSFTVKTVPVSADTNVTLVAKIGAISKQATISLRAPTLAAFAISANSVTGGGSIYGSVRLSSVAAKGGDVVKIISNSGDVIVPATVTVPANETSARITITTKHVTSATKVTITASSNGISTSDTLTLNP